MIIKIRQINPNAQIPTYGSEGAACFDFYACIDKPVTINPKGNVNIPTGLQFEIPEGFVMLMYSRSGHGFKNGIRFVNGTGVIDSDYRGEVRVGLFNDGITPYIVKPNERIAQAMIVPIPRIDFIKCETLSKTKRGQGGFGSTGK